MEEEIIGCLWDGAEVTDYVLCDGDESMLPNLYKKDEIRFEYNQWNQERSRNSCTIFSAIGMLSDLINYEFSLDEIKEVDELSYTKWRIRWNWWWVKNAVDLVAKWYNDSELSKNYGKVAYYRISKYNDSIIENVIDKLYTINWNHWLNSDYTKDKKDWMIDWTDFWNITNWHAVDVINYKWQRSVKNSYKWNTNNIYWLKNELSKLSNFWPNFYVYTLIKEDNMEELKRLNEFKATLIQTIENNSNMWHITNDENYKKELNKMNNANRKKLEDINSQLKKLS